MDERFEEVEHTADIAIRVWGRDLAQLFANAAYGMACQLADVATVERTVEHEIQLEDWDAETLLVSWLDEFLYANERDGLVFTDFDMLEVSPTRLRAVVRGGPAPVRWYSIKAVTFNDLRIVRTAEGYETTIVFDV
jgi:SHS2 domain-containing protein